VCECREKVFKILIRMHIIHKRMHITHKRMHERFIEWHCINDSASSRNKGLKVCCVLIHQVMGYLSCKMRVGVHA